MRCKQVVHPRLCRGLTKNCFVLELAIVAGSIYSDTPYTLAQSRGQLDS